MCRSTGIRTRGAVHISFGTYNIHNGRNGGLESALRGLYQANMDLVIFRKQSSLMTYTPAGRLGIALLRWTRQADTAAEWQCSTGQRRISR